MKGNLQCGKRYLQYISDKDLHPDFISTQQINQKDKQRSGKMGQVLKHAIHKRGPSNGQIK